MIVLPEKSKMSPGCARFLKDSSEILSTFQNLGSRQIRPVLFVAFSLEFAMQTSSERVHS